MMLWIKIEVTDNNIRQIFKVKAIKNARIANFVYYGKTRMCTAHVHHLRTAMYQPLVYVFCLLLVVKKYQVDSTVIVNCMKIC